MENLFIRFLLGFLSAFLGLILYSMIRQDLKSKRGILLNIDLLRNDPIAPPPPTVSKKKKR
ncbi:MAG: hypothetical protein AABZ14_07305 [Candidatus Margulisiibacteriota bacterium]